MLASVSMLLLSASAATLRVAVTGAGGQTGQLAFRKMLARPSDFNPVGIVRTEQSRAALVDSGIPAECVKVADVTDPAAIAAAIEGCSALIIATSAKPAPSGKMDEASGRPIFAFPNGQPEEVDWLGQKAQIDAAKACGADTHVVMYAAPVTQGPRSAHDCTCAPRCRQLLIDGRHRPEQHAERTRTRDLDRRFSQGRKHLALEAQGTLGRATLGRAGSPAREFLCQPRETFGCHSHARRRNT